VRLTALWTTDVVLEDRVHCIAHVVATYWTSPDVYRWNVEFYIHKSAQFLVI